MNCNFCHKEFKSISSLNYHQKSAKYCLGIQGKDLCDHYKCDRCDKLFSTKYSLNCHNDICKESKEQEIEKYKDLYESMRVENQTYKILLSERENTIKSLEKHISELSKTISDIAKQPKTTTNNNIKTQNNTHILTDYKTYDEYTSKERILSLEKDNNIEEYFWKGQRGVAEFVYDQIVKTEDGKMIICCTDLSRNRFKYKNESNGISEDIDAHIFHKKISDPIKQIYNNVHNNIQKGLEEQIITGSKQYTKTDLKFKKDVALEKNTEIQMISNYDENGEYRKAIAMHLKV